MQIAYEVDADAYAAHLATGKGWDGTVKGARKIEKLETEVDVLKMKVEALNGGWDDTLKAARFKIKRFEKEIDALRAEVEISFNREADHRTARDDARAEAKALREALVDVVTPCDDETHNRCITHCERLPCPHAKARDVLDAHPAPTETSDE